jgi:cob(I)alamin adenosyltransferase
LILKINTVSSPPWLDTLPKLGIPWLNDDMPHRATAWRFFLSETDQTYNDPKLAINKVYTKTGDKGKTSLVGGQRLPKHAPRIEAYGTLDELMAHLGSLRVSVGEAFPVGKDREWFDDVLLRVQHELFNLGSILATLPEDVHPKQPTIRQADIAALERDIDQVNDELPALRSFVLPGGNRANSDCHVCRTVCRRAERIVTALAENEEVPNEGIVYLNRLSDAFFVWSRWISHVLGSDEVLWQPNKAASAQAT